MLSVRKFRKSGIEKNRKSEIGNREKSEIEDRKSSQYFFNMATLFRYIGAPLLNAIDPFAFSLQ